MKSNNSFLNVLAGGGGETHRANLESSDLWNAAWNYFCWICIIVQVKKNVLSQNFSLENKLLFSVSELFLEEWK